jgi:hypothetical protein
MAFPSFALSSGDLLIVTLPDGQSLEIDARDPSDVIVWHCNVAGDAVASLDIEPEPDTDPGPAKTADHNTGFLSSHLMPQTKPAQNRLTAHCQGLVCHLSKCHTTG